MKNLFKMMKHMNIIAAVILTMIGAGVLAVTETLNARVISRIYDQISRNDETILYSIGILALLMLISIIFKYGGFLYKGKLAEEKSAKLRTELFEKTVNADSLVLQEINIDEIINAGANATQYIKSMMSSVHTVASMIASLISNYIVMISNNITLTVIITVLLILLLIVNLWLGRVFASYADEKSNGVTQVIKSYNRIRNYPVIKSFCRENNETKKMGKISNKLGAISLKKRRIATGMGASMGIMNSIIMLSIFIYAAHSKMKVSDIILFVALFENIFGIFAWFTDIIDEISEVISVNNKIYRILDTEQEKDGTIELESFNNSIVFNDVSFSYKKSENVLHGINIEIPKGKKIGIYGPSGEGKSTFINLISRYYKVDSGQILIDNIDINDLTASSLRQKIGIVSQDIYLFDGTIEENIKYGRPKATKSEIVNAAKAANAYEFISKFKDGFNTNIGRDGIKLSGGQKQRISIARMILANPDIIILDEATSKLDNESERLVQEAIDKYNRDKTVISIAHRLSTLNNCDYLIGIKNHTVYESGTKTELLSNKDSLYYKLLMN